MNLQEIVLLSLAVPLVGPASGFGSPLLAFAAGRVKKHSIATRF